MIDTREGSHSQDETLVLPPALASFVDRMGDFQLMTLGAMDLMRDLSREDISGRALSAKIARDPTLSARILRLANSSYYGTAHRIATVNQAVTMIGIDNVRRLVQGLCMVEMSTPHGGVSKHFGGRAFAAHALAVSYLAGVLTGRIGFQNLGKGEAETAGLIHDIGMCLLGSGDPKTYQDIQVRFWGQVEDYLQAPEGASIVSVEESMLGFTHAHLGGWLAQQWNLPLNIQESLAWHHGPLRNVTNQEAVVVVHLAEILTNEHEMDYLPMGGCGRIHPDVIQFLESRGKGQFLETLHQSLAREISKAKQLHQLILTEEQKEEKQTVELKGEELPRPAIPKGAVKPIRLPVPWWSYLLPGAPQLIRGELGMGVGFLAGFLFALAFFVLTYLSGGIVLSLVFLFVSIAIWLLSIILE
jgi:HD-like signal output (HDOD) protein